MSKLLVLAIAILTSACSHLAVTIPTPLIETPEIAGGDGSAIGAGILLQSGHKYEATGDASARPPNLTTPETDHVLSTLGQANVDFAKRFRLGVGGDPINGGLYGRAQIQLLGEGRATAKAGNFSLSIFGHAGQHTPDKSGDQSGNLGPGGNPWNGEIQTDWYDFGASLGYRLTDAATIFLGAGKQLTLYRTTISQTQGAAPLGTYATHDRAEANKAMLGMSWGGQRGELFVAADYTDIQYHKAGPLYIATATLGFTLDMR